MTPSEEEQKLLDILNQPEISDPAEDEGVRDAVETAFPDMDNKAKRVMERVMAAELPSPEEIATAEQIAQHNAEVDRRRKEDLAERRAKRAARGNSRIRKRRRGKKG